MSEETLTPREIRNLEWRILYACQTGNDWDVKELFSLAKSIEFRNEVKRIYSSVRVCGDGTHYLAQSLKNKTQYHSTSLNPTPCDPHMSFV